MATSLGVLFYVRPLLIDLKYGQVNQIIVCLLSVALIELYQPKAKVKRLLQWMSASVFSISKIFPAVLLIIPFVSFFENVQKKDYQKSSLWAAIGILVGAMILFSIPFISLSTHDFIQTYQDWIKALGAKGLPVETHNQSFLAFLMRVLFNVDTYSRVVGPYIQNYGFKVVQDVSVLKIWQLVFSLLSLGFILGTALSYSRKKVDKTILAALAICFVPSYLVWKPYFIFGIPLAIVLMERTIRFNWVSQARILFVTWIFLTFTSVHFIGAKATGWFEGWSFMLWLQLVLVGLSFRTPPLKQKVIS